MTDTTIVRPRTSRRALLGAAALPAIAAAASVGPDPHLGWLAEWCACHDTMNGPAGETVDCLSELPAWHRARDLERLVAETPARTLAGAVAQLRLAYAFMEVYGHLGEGINDEALLENAISTLERLAEERAA